MIELARALEHWGICLEQWQLTAFERYYHELIEWNRKFNLTRITSREDVARFHFLDSLSLYLHRESLGLPSSERMVDVGSGAGFPGVPAKIAFPHLGVALVESSSKKAAFLRHIVSTLDLPGVDVLASRAEQVARSPEHRERYDLAAARAVAPIAVLAELLLPFARIGGRAVAFKTEDTLEELEEARAAIESCGGALGEVLPYRIPGAEKTRVLISIVKVASTPSRFPRGPGIPFKRPIR